jgi:16S rRNA (guanine966-N2)-methyltransferase
MGERIRNSLFNSIGSEIEGAVVLDAFAGSGSLGLESISRGANFAVFVENDRIAGRVLDENIAALGLSDQAQAIHAGVASWIKSTDQRYDIIFADPPYNNPQFSTVSQLFGLLKPNGLMVLSYPGRSEAPTETGVVVVDNRSYGTAALTFYRLNH